MRIKLIKFMVLYLVCFNLFSFSNTPKIDTITNATFQNVKTAISNALPGSIIFIKTNEIIIWDSSIVINKPITLFGLGSENTIIKSNITEYNSGIFSYIPSVYNDNYILRISGFTLDGNDKSNCIYMNNSSISKKCFVRIDNNRIINAGGAAKNVRITGTIYGVIDNNVIEVGNKDVGISNYGITTGYEEWNSLEQKFGDGDVIFYEDNVFYGYNTFFDCGHGGRYVARYNTFYSLNALYPLFDFHGNQDGLYGSMVGEVYGNEIIMNDYGAYFIGQRGGQLLSFYNKISGSKIVSLYFSEEHHDTIPKNNGFKMHITNSYYWNNRRNGLLLPYLVMKTINYPAGLVPSVNDDFYIESETFDGSEGCGCGKLEDRPNKCKKGVAYWATDQPCTNDSSYFGRHPKIKIQGILYKCIDDNIWSGENTSYKPYVYPHPMREFGKSDIKDVQVR